MPRDPQLIDPRPKRPPTPHPAVRYMYQPVIAAASAEGAPDKAKGSSCMLYKQYKLSDARTFASFFHPDKAAVLSLVDQFTAKRGKFAIPGYPQKLGFLLHGPPGIGKVTV